ncbi:MAG: thymidylate synthase [Lachnospiraceae bacterium]
MICEKTPAITLRRIALKSAMDEVLWIYQKKSNNIHDLNSHVWTAGQMRMEASEPAMGM